MQPISEQVSHTASSDGSEVVLQSRATTTEPTDDHFFKLWCRSCSARTAAEEDRVQDERHEQCDGEDEVEAERLEQPDEEERAAAEVGKLFGILLADVADRTEDGNERGAELTDQKRPAEVEDGEDCEIAEDDLFHVEDTFR
jgi:hypothetical protein